MGGDALTAAAILVDVYVQHRWNEPETKIRWPESEMSKDAHVQNVKVDIAALIRDASAVCFDMNVEIMTI